jgi:ribosome maturation factor RimP
LVFDDRDLACEVPGKTGALPPDGEDRPGCSCIHGIHLFLEKRLNHVALQQIVEQTVAGLGYDLVEIERSAGGLLRITIDLPWSAPPEEGAAGPEPFVTVEDCEKVTRQLQFALEVDAVDYKRLEVSSPGIDRPLRHQQDFERFAGHVVDITLRAPLGAAAAAGGTVNANRKKFRGTLERLPDAPDDRADAPAAAGPRWQIVWSDEPPPKPGQRVSRKRAPPTLQALGFTLDELREARLAPIVDFKGRNPGNALDAE